MPRSLRGIRGTQTKPDDPVRACAACGCISYGYVQPEDEDKPQRWVWVEQHTLWCQRALRAP